MDLQFLAHGEICAGGLPKPPVNNPDKPEADLSAFLLGRTRLSLNYERNWLEAKITLQNNAVWGMRNNMSVDLYEGWVKMKSKNGFFTKIGRVALSLDPTILPQHLCRTMWVWWDTKDMDTRFMVYSHSTRIVKMYMRVPIMIMVHSTIRLCKPCGITTICPSSRWEPHCSL